MCGIAGRYNWRTRAPAARAELQRMAEDRLSMAAERAQERV